MGHQTWAGAAREVWRGVARHKIISGLVAVCVVGSLIAIAVTGSGSAASGKTAAASGQVTTNQVAPAFSLAALGNSGSHVALSNYAGQPLIVNFFASWCEPCKAETPLLASFYRSEHGKVALVGLDENDSQSSAVTFTHAKGVSYPVGFDPEVIAGSAYGVAALPQTFFLNAQHHIVDRIYGAVTLAEINHGIALATGG
jgi:cytochrome c biogenesis protein CcmG/thiol:disulfide interchange protein DsbE